MTFLVLYVRYNYQNKNIIDHIKIIIVLGNGVIRDMGQNNELKQIKY